MRLIDADKLIEIIEAEKKKVEKDAAILPIHEEALRGMQAALCAVVSSINEQPTAYDVEKVVEELEAEKEIAEKEMEECIFKALPYHDSTEGKVIGIKNAIDIVRKGGIDENSNRFFKKR